MTRLDDVFPRRRNETALTRGWGVRSGPDPRHDPGPRTSTASRPGAATGQSPRRAERGITQRARRARADEPPRLSFYALTTALRRPSRRDGRIASALAEGRPLLNSRARLGAIRPS